MLRGVGAGFDHRIEEQPHGDAHDHADGEGDLDSDRGLDLGHVRIFWHRREIAFADEAQIVVNGDHAEQERR